MSLITELLALIPTLRPPFSGVPQVMSMSEFSTIRLLAYIPVLAYMLPLLLYSSSPHVNSRSTSFIDSVPS